jgi:hypothetical protein
MEEKKAEAVAVDLDYKELYFKEFKRNCELSDRLNALLDLIAKAGKAI